MRLLLLGGPLRTLRHLVALPRARMSDSNLRTLERKAAGGSLREQAAHIRALVRSGSPLPPILERPKPDDVWICKDGSYGCTIRHRSERISLAHCGKLERKAERSLSRSPASFLPHRIECHSLIYGTSYPCERARVRSLLPLERAEYADLLADGERSAAEYASLGTNR